MDLSDNQITAIPKKILQLTNLKQLDLIGNQLTELPDFICEMNHLTEFNLRGNKLTELPDRLGKLVNLTRLDLRDNQLKSLPRSLEDLKDLTELYLSNNYLKKSLLQNKLDKSKSEILKEDRTGQKELNMAAKKTISENRESKFGKLVTIVSVAVILVIAGFFAVLFNNPIQTSPEQSQPKSN